MRRSKTRTARDAALICRVRTYREEEKVISIYALHVKEAPSGILDIMAPNSFESTGANHFMEYVRGGGPF